MSTWTRIQREDLYLDCEETWGLSAEQDMLGEECAELIVAMNKFRRHPSEESLDKLAEELADVIFMSEEIMYLIDKKHPGFGLDVRQWLYFKLDRTRARIDNADEYRLSI